MRCLTVEEVVKLQERVLQQSGGMAGIRDASGLASAVAQPHMTFAGADLYPRLIDKVAALGFSLIANHPFVDGYKRIGHAAMEVFLYLNGCGIQATVEEQENFALALAAGAKSRNDLVEWLHGHTQSR